MALAEHIDEELLTLTRQKTLQQQPCTYADKEALVRGLLAAPGKAQAMRKAADDASEGAAADPRKQQQTSTPLQQQQMSPPMCSYLAKVHCSRCQGLGHPT